ncbi:MAG TPA: ABC transporter permease [Ktedonosporobacter sp.]|nr:ABC transporter permease [Ktedonosporobacter sp.]
MTFLALLTKELRLRLRRERTIWVIIAYIFLMGVLGWLALNSASNAVRYSNSALSNVGLNLYYLLSLIQLLLIVFITPSLTASAVNGERERQTFDLLLCSRLSAFSLIAGKLVAGLTNALLLIAASAPLFSLVFFFGGVTPFQVMEALLVYVVTVLMLGTVGIFFSVLFKRSGISTAVTYIFSLCWVAFPAISSFILLSSGRSSSFFQLYPVRSRLLFLWNPVTALLSTYGPTQGYPSYYLWLGFYGFAYNGTASAPIALGKWMVNPLMAYCLSCFGLALALFLISVWLIKPALFPFWRRNAPGVKISPHSAAALPEEESVAQDTPLPEEEVLAQGAPRPEEETSPQSVSLPEEKASPQSVSRPEEKASPQSSPVTEEEAPAQDASATEEKASPQSSS